MKATENTLDGHALVVLNEDHVQALFLHIPLIIGFHEVTAMVTVDGRFDDIKTLNGALGDFDLSHSYSSISFR